MLALLSYPAILKAQNPFRKPRTLQEIIGRKQNEFKKWIYKASPAYVKNAIFNVGVFQYPLVITHNFFYAGDITRGNRNIFTLSPKKYAESIGFFCQKELQLDKITPVAFRFRLGSLDYVNWMEQKLNAVKPVVH